MKKVLITGSTGFAGKHLINYLEKNPDYQIFGTYISSNPGDREATKYIQLDLNNSEDVIKVINSVLPDHVYHLAALTSPAESIQNPAQTITNNISAQINLLEAIKNSENPKSKILVVSSADVYGRVADSDIPIDEKTPLNPTNPYAVSKITQDFLGLQYFLAHDMQILRVRPFNHIGAGQEPKFVVPSFAKQIAEIEKGQKDPVLKVGNLEARKDFSDVRDIVIGYHSIIEKGRVGDVYNLGSGLSIKIGDLLNKLLSLSSASIKVEKDDSLYRPSETVDFVCDNNKARIELNWEPKIPLDDSLKETLDYWRKVL